MPLDSFSKRLHDPSGIVMLSGGIDSVSETDEKLYVHHIHIKNGEGKNIRRYKMEAKAVRKIIPYMKKNYRDFHYSESTIDVKQLFDIKFSYKEDELYRVPYVYDDSYYSFIGGTLALTTHSSVVYTGGRNHEYTEDMPVPVNEDTNEIEIIKTKNNVMDSIFHGAAWPYKAELKRLFLSLYYDKKTCIEYLEDELMSMVWYCREPTLKDGHIITCNNCSSCKDVLEAKRRGKYG